MTALAISVALFLSAAPAPDVDPLQHLVGGWKVTGTIRGKPVHQLLDVKQTLGGAFYELHFTSKDAPREGMPPYEARVFIGWDAKGQRYVAHWLDVFGAAGADVVGQGKRTTDGAVIEYPYSSGMFRNTFSFDATAGTWRLLIEAKDKKGKWSTFADETFHSEDVLR